MFLPKSKGLQLKCGEIPIRVLEKAKLELISQLSPQQICSAKSLA